jgi:hypothetical protein
VASNSKEDRERSQMARAEKMKAANVEGAKAMAEREAHARHVRANTEKLRALRLAKEAADRELPPAPKPGKKKKKAVALES